MAITVKELYITWLKAGTHQMPVLFWWVGQDVKEAQQKSND